MELTPQAWQASLQLGWTYSIEQFSKYLPNLLGAVFILFVGWIVARVVKSIIVRTLEALRVSSFVEKTPFGDFLKNAELGQKVEDVVGGIAYWLLILVVVHSAVTMLGLVTLSNFFARIIDYIPHVFTAFLIFIFGVVLAGLVESVIKGTLRSLEAHSARLFAKVASYGVVTIAALAAVAELGIASEFIRILFIGFVFAVSLGSGLAVGLGGQDTIRKMMEAWREKK